LFQACSSDEGPTTTRSGVEGDGDAPPGDGDAADDGSDSADGADADGSDVGDADGSDGGDADGSDADGSDGSDADGSDGGDADGSDADGSDVGDADGSDVGDADDGQPGPTLALDAVQMRGTHNSYHQEPAIAFDASHKYTHLPLDQQLENQGVRVFELDLHNANSDDSIDVYHIVGIDPRSTCPNFEDCLRTLRGWSDAHPTHVPIIVWVELKDDTGGAAFQNADKIDEVLRQELGDKLFTPDELQGSAASLHEAIAGGWPSLDSVRGRIIFIMLNNDEDIDQYTQGYTTTAGKEMFPRVNADRFESPVAAFAKLDVADSDGVNKAHAARLIVGTNVCAVNTDDATCEQHRVSAIAAGFHLLQDDLPAPIAGRSYYMALPEGKPVACNPVRAPEGCTAEALEAL
jgi:hypothetical protein